MQDRINADLKQAMLAGDKQKTELLRNLNSAFLYESVALGIKDKGITDEDVQRVLMRESKKRAEAIDIYQKAGETDRVAAENQEKAIIDSYLPDQLSETDLKAIIDKHVAALSAAGVGDMGKVIGAVRAEVGATANGALIAKLVREALGS